MAFGLGLLFAVALGLPSFLLLRRWGNASLTTGLAAGALIAAAPVLLLTLGANPDEASSGGVATVIEGRRTLAGWLQVAMGAAFSGGIGAVAGGVFWAVLRWTGALKGSVRAEPSSGRSRIALGGATAAAVGLALLPAATADRSCHNALRSGARSITPPLSATLDIREADWPRLSAVLARFAGAQGLAFRDRSETRPQVAVLSLWRGTDVPAFRDQGVHLSLYQVRRDTPWRPTAQALAAELERAFPGRVGFRDGMGRPIGLAQALQGRPEATTAD
jgi:hypothetical protein